MKTHFILMLLFGILTIPGCGEQEQKQGQEAAPEPTFGKIQLLKNFPSKYVDGRDVAVWLPENFDPNRKYAVLYMQDGKMLFDKKITWNNKEWKMDEVMTKLQKQNKIRDCIVVGIYNNGELRGAEYFPQKPFEYLEDLYKNPSPDPAIKKLEDPLLFEGPVYSDNYLRFMVEELKPEIDRAFPTLPDAANTFVGGSSMGGLISMYALCEYPEIFGGAACISTHWIGMYSAENNPIPDAFMQYLDKHLPPPGNHKFYFDYGTETLDAAYEPFQKMADAILKQKGYTEKNHLTRKFVGHEHSELAWQKRLHIPLTFLLGHPGATIEDVLE